MCNYAVDELVTHFRFLNTIRDSPTPPQEYVRNEEQV